MKQPYYLLTIAALMASLHLSAQTVVKGHVVNTRGETVEYVSIGFEDDSVGVISDIRGHFEITIPQGRTDDLSFTHVSYLPSIIPHSEYANGQELTVVLHDKVVELTEVVIGKKNKPKTIVGRGMPMPGGVLGVSGHGSPDGLEGGITFSCNKDYVISDILLNIAGCSYKQCTISINLYEKRDGRFVNILQKPLYEIIRQETGTHLLDVRPEENLLLKRKTDYYISLAVVDSDSTGMLYIKPYLKSGLFRNNVKGKTKRLPVCPAIRVKGYEVE